MRKTIVPVLAAVLGFAHVAPAAAADGIFRVTLLGSGTPIPSPIASVPAL